MNRPTVIMNFAMTVDGKIASAAREYPRLTSPTDLARMDSLRAESDAVLVGAETVRSIDPPTHIRDERAQAKRSAAGKSRGPMSIVLSGSGKVPLDAKALSDPTAAARIIATTEAGSILLKKVPDRVELWRSDGNSVDLPILVERLLQRGVKRLLVEGGAETNARFIEEDLVDEIYVTIAPAILGGATSPTPVGGAGLSMAQRREFSLVEMHREADEIYCHYRRKR